ncbi:uncharacterized protein si:dkeyp-51f12.3 [Triplophysa dalaica]|uniref:uncharacterized protein si:dkeyp-51f12.3 n=1 Tax=Triplophysa dalaica TaxID=1582913 RepID=UPI0024E03D50|nr:uncharacterized protein si:dkeyp-51f12.3 [Triplophysa dalaica]
MGFTRTGTPSRPSTDVQLHVLFRRDAGDSVDYYCDGITRRDNMSSKNKWPVLFGLLLVIAGVVLIIIGKPYFFYVGLAVTCLGVFTFTLALCLACKPSHVTVPGHCILHPRTGICYTPHQALAVQRRLDRIRRAAEENHNEVQTLPSSGTNQLSLPGTPPPWQMEPPPSYETVMKTTTAIDQ